MRVLAIDTALGACQAAVLDGDAVLAARAEPMERGQQERLAPMVREVLDGAGLGPRELDRIGVTVGPGSFTGLRVGLAFAKGFSLGTALPCVGVGTLEALAASWRSGLVAAVIDARRERVYLQLFRDGLPLGPPELADIADAERALAALDGGRRLVLVGPGAPLLAGPGREVQAAVAPDVAQVARLVARAAEPRGRPTPLYLRTPDAKTIAERTAGAAGS